MPHPRRRNATPFAGHDQIRRDYRRPEHAPPRAKLVVLLETEMAGCPNGAEEALVGRLCADCHCGGGGGSGRRGAGGRVEAWAFGKWLRGCLRRAKGAVSSVGYLAAGESACELEDDVGEMLYFEDG